MSKIKLPPPRRLIPDLRKLALRKRQEWPHGRRSFNAVYVKAKRHKVVIRSLRDREDPELIHYWRVG